MLSSLIERLRALQPDSRRRWGTMTAHEMVCHLGDSAAMALGTRPRPEPVPVRRRPVVKWLGLWAPIPWPRGWPTNPSLNPRVGGTRPSAFESDRTRAIEGLEALAAAAALIEAHGVFGAMSARDWHRWAFRHTDHHLRQFGL